jgi:hypothetical protein
VSRCWFGFAVARCVSSRDGDGDGTQGIAFEAGMVRNASRSKPGAFDPPPPRRARALCRSLGEGRPSSRASRPGLSPGARRRCRLFSVRWSGSTSARAPRCIMQRRHRDRRAAQCLGPGSGRRSQRDAGGLRRAGDRGQLSCCRGADDAAPEPLHGAGPARGGGVRAEGLPSPRDGRRRGWLETVWGRRPALSPGSTTALRQRSSGPPSPARRNTNATPRIP